MSTGATEREVAKRLLNTALVNCHLNPGHKFPWAERRGVIITHAPYSTGTVSITTATSRTAVAGASTLWSTAVTGYAFDNAREGGKIKFAGGPEHYIVYSVTSDTALSLLTTYVGDDLSAVSYVYYEDEYALEQDFLRFVDMQNFSTEMEIPLIGRTDFRRYFPRNDLTGRPKVATQIQVSFSGSVNAQHRVVFNPAPNDEYQIPYWYVTRYLAVSSIGTLQDRMDADADEPIIPRGKRQMLTLYAKFEYYNDYKDDARAAGAFQEYEIYLKRVAGEVTASDAKPQLYVAHGGRGGIGRQRYDYGSRFDEIRDRWRWR